ncbi:hypothetical protein GCM10025864_00940 [Luteimicrobium album]|uniref:Uncharacterized protein n=1 Tax=Luteimicrobium album TaxID=1054550 RepID=A0ABQ6HXP0_9MICO|nr:hypothetical protein GCM10025864_00940 [Luteimicrobium album]
MHGVGAGTARDVEQLRLVEVRLLGAGTAEGVRLGREVDVRRVAVLVGVDGDGRDPGVGAGPRHTDGDLAAVRDEDLRHGTGGGGGHVRRSGHGLP